MYYRNTKINAKDRVEYQQYLRSLQTKKEIETAIHFDSVYRNEGDSPNADDFTIYFPSPLRNVVAICLSSCRFPNVSNLINSNRNSLTWQKSSSSLPLAITVQSGQYSINTLLNAVIQEMNKLDTGSKYIYVLDTATNAIEIQSWLGSVTCALDPFQYDVATSTVTCSTLNAHALTVNQNFLIQNVTEDPWTVLNTSFTVKSIIDDNRFTFLATSLNTSFSSDTTGGGQNITLYKEQPIKFIHTPTSVLPSIGFPRHDTGMELSRVDILCFDVKTSSSRKHEWSGTFVLSGGEEIISLQYLNFDKVDNINSLPVVVISEDGTEYNAELNKIGSSTLSYSRRMWPIEQKIIRIVLPRVLVQCAETDIYSRALGSMKPLNYNLCADYATGTEYQWPLRLLQSVNRETKTFVWVEVLDITNLAQATKIKSWTMCGTADSSLGYSASIKNNTDKYVAALINDLYIHVCTPDLAILNQINQSQYHDGSGLTKTHNVMSAIKLDSNPDSFIFSDQGSPFWLYLKKDRGGRDLPTLQKLRLTLKSPNNDLVNLKNMNYSGVITLRQAMAI